MIRKKKNIQIKGDVADHVTDEKEKLARFLDLTEITEKASHQESPEAALRSLPGGKAAAWRPFWTSAFATDLILGFLRPVTKRECAFYFLLTGFFYSVFGLILMLGQKRLTMDMYLASWLEMQTVLNLIAAFCLIVSGAALYVDGDLAARVVRIGTAVYAGVVILNGWNGAVSIHMPAAVFFSMTSAAAGLIIAAFLTLAVDRYNKTTTH